VADGNIINDILSYGPVFLLIAVRAFAMIQTAPLLSSESIPRAAKFALAGMAAFAVLPTAEIFAVEGTAIGRPGAPVSGAVVVPELGGLHLITDLRYEPFSFRFLLLVIGEAMIGIILGFFLTVIFAAFTSAGQFFSLQMGFAASAAFDPLAQVENPLIGQFLHLIAMLVFIVIGGFGELFLGGFWRSVQSLSVIGLIEGREPVISMMASGLSRLFLDAIVISLPMLGTLFLISLTTGLISKAAPQINILSEGFPIAIMVGYVVLLVSLPFMIEAFAGVINSAFATIETLYIQIGRQIEYGGWLW